jgi:GTP:adenosylcobinamide-phosphate guanylyltransferase
LPTRPVMHALILAGGRGSRLKADGVTTPKAFVEIGGRPLVFRLVETLHELGCETTTVAIRREALDEAGFLAREGEARGCRFVPCATPSSLHTLARGLEVVPPGPVLCAMVETVMRPEDWQRLFGRADRALSQGADACVAVTPYVDDENPLWVARRADGTVSAFGVAQMAPALVTGGVCFLSSRIRDLAPRVLSLGVIRMRGFLAWMVEHGYAVATVEVERIVDLERRRNLAQATTWLGVVEPGPDLGPPEPSRR